MSTIKEYLEEIQGRPVAVIGMGVSNTPLIKMLLRAGAEVTVRDRVPRERAAEQVQELESLGARMILGDEYLQDLHEDVIFRTPGLSPNTPELVNAVQRGIELSSEMELFFQTCPSRLIGVTGSDGKTTTTTIIAEFLKEAGRNVYVGGNIGKPLLPDVADMVEEDFAVLELSSFQLMTMEQSPHIAVVTNLSPNHLDYHHTFDDYFEAKALLFSKDYPARRVISIDGSWGRELLRRCTAAGDEVITTGFDVSAQIHPVEVTYEAARTKAVLEVRGTRIAVEYPLVGRFNVENVMTAFGCALALGIPTQIIAEALATMPAVPGRLERVRPAVDAPVSVYVDYAHTPDALTKAIASIKELSGGRTIVVFGCGGNRDATKRPIMGAAALAADYAVVTSDNPRHEEPDAIIADIVAGMEDAERFTVEPDRRSAIAAAIALARPGDAILVAGKGHEDYQLVGDEVLSFDDRVVAAEELERAFGGACSD